MLGALDPPPIGDLSRSNAKATLQTIVSSSFADDLPQDDDPLGESTLKRADERTRTAFLLIASVRSVIAERCTGLRISHK